MERWESRTSEAFRRGLAELREVLQRMESHEFLSSLSRIVEIIASALEEGGKILVMGNGGSASDSQHMAAEIVGAFKDRAKRGLPAIALTTDSSVLTSIANDYSYSEVFLRQVQALADKRDVLVLISTSGNSENIVRVGRYAREKGIRCVALLGKGGGTLKGICNAELVVPSNETPRVQEIHIFLIHTICELLEKYLKR